MMPIKDCLYLDPDVRHSASMLHKSFAREMGNGQFFSNTEMAVTESFSRHLDPYSYGETANVFSASQRALIFSGLGIHQPLLLCG